MVAALVARRDRLRAELDAIEPLVRFYGGPPVGEAPPAPAVVTPYTPHMAAAAQKPAAAPPGGRPPGKPPAPRAEPGSGGAAGQGGSNKAERAMARRKEIARVLAAGDRGTTSLARATGIPLGSMGGLVDHPWFAKASAEAGAPYTLTPEGRAALASPTSPPPGPPRAGTSPS